MQDREVIMKKRLLSLTLVLCMSAMAVTGCKKEEASKKEEKKEETLTIETIPVEDDNAQALHKALMKRYGDAALEYGTLEDYSNLALEVDAEVVVTDEVFNSEIDAILTEYAYAFTGEVASGQTVNIDYAGSLNGELFDGGSDEYFDLTIGSKTFIDGFEEQLIGMKVGETRTINVTFPENYDTETLAGKETQFVVTANAIAIDEGKSELTQQWIEMFMTMNGGILTDTTPDGFKAYMRESMETYYAQLRESNEMNATANKLAEIITLKDGLSSKYKNYYKTTFEEELTAYAEQYGYTLEDYITQLGMDEETYADELDNTAELSMKYEFALVNIGEKEGLAPTEEQYTAYLTEVAESAGMSLEDYRAAQQATYQLQCYLSAYEENVLNFLLEKATITDVTSSAVTTE